MILTVIPTLCFLISMVTLASININGLNNMAKFDEVLINFKSDILVLQETNWTQAKMPEIKEKWRGLLFVNCGTARSCGVAILVKEDVVENVKEVLNDGKGRVIGIDFDVNNVTYRLINVYAPNREVEKRLFFISLGLLCTRNCVLVGDFNVFCSKLDVYRRDSFRQDSARKVLFKMIEDGGLVDVWRVRNAAKREFSRRQIVNGVLKQSRIDLCLARQDIADTLSSVQYKFTGYSDHAAIIFQMGDRSRGTGGGVWCLNTSVLEESEYIEMVRGCVKEQMNCVGYDADVCEWWECVKIKVKMLSIKYCKKRSQVKRRTECVLRERMAEELRRLDDDVNRDLADYIGIKGELESHERERCKGAIVRSRVKYAVDGEKCTSFFLGLEKRKQGRTYIAQIEGERGEVVNDFVGVLERVQGFYSDLFSKGYVDKDSVDKVLGTVEHVLSDSDREVCECELVESEVTAAVSSLSNNKSPGSDGLPAEFYKCFSELLCPILLKVYREMERLGMVSKSMSTGLISVLYKNKGSKLQLGNYRGLSLLNTDYKVLAKILANRIKSVVGTIVSSTQTYSIPGRDIADTIGSVRDVVRHMKEEGGVVLSVDFNKAFDRVEHEFMFRALERFGFGDRLVKWIRLLYSNAKSRVKCNGVLTDSFRLERSVRQGCPLSALLYSITAEPLATMLKKDQHIQGINIPGGGRSLIHQYADDTSITVRNLASVKRVIELLGIYGSASGAKINLEKSEILCVGAVDMSECDIPLTVSKGMIKVLGVNVGVDEKEARDVTWTGVLNKVKQNLNLWKMRKLRLRGKVIVVNCLMMSRVNHVLSTLDLPLWVVKDLNGAVNNFLWDGKPAKIAHKVLTNGYEDGGLKLIDVEVKKRALRVKTIKKYLYGKEEYCWMGFFEDYLHRYGGCGVNGLFMMFNKPRCQGMSYFYREVFEAWGKYLEYVKYECVDRAEVLNQPIFQNPKILHNNRILVSKHFEKAGVKQVKHLMLEGGNVFKAEQVIIRDVRRVNRDVRGAVVVGMYRRVKESIGTGWMTLLLGQGGMGEENTMVELGVERGGKRVKFEDVSTKSVYMDLMGGGMKRPASEKVWGRVFEGFDVKKIWGNLNVKYNSIECEHNDFKIRHNRVFTNVVLHQIDRTVGRVCNVCKEVDETFDHYFIECSMLFVFLEKVKDLLSVHCGIKVGNDVEWKKLLLFGVVGKVKDVNVDLVNFMLSTVRHAIVCRRNVAQDEGRVIRVWEWFVATFKKNVRLVHTLRREDFHKFFVRNSTLVMVTESGTLGFSV